MVSAWKESTNLDGFTWSYESYGRCPWNGAQWLRHRDMWDRKEWKLSVSLGSVRECTVRLVSCWPFACPAFMLCRKKKSEGKIIKVFIFKKGLNYTVKPHYSWIPSLIILLLVQIYCNCNLNNPDAFQCHSQTYTCWPAAAWLTFGCNSPDIEQTRVSACTLQAGFLQPVSAHFLPFLLLISEHWIIACGS